MDLCNDQGLNNAISKVASDMKAIHDEFTRVAMIAGSDLRKRKIKEMQNGGANPAKEPYATEEELARTKQLTAKLRAASHEFIEACHELVSMRDAFGLRQAKRSALKVRISCCCLSCRPRSLVDVVSLTRE